jgi:DNA-binding transcriptional ArsR family regulator
MPAVQAMKSQHPAFDAEVLRGAASRAVGVMKVLANEDRMLLLCQLSQGEMCVGDLEERLAIRQPTLSQQLGVLRAEGVVTTRRDGKHIYYRVADRKLIDLLALLYRLYCPEE